MDIVIVLNPFLFGEHLCQPRPKSLKLKAATKNYAYSLTRQTNENMMLFVIQQLQLFMLWSTIKSNLITHVMCETACLIIHYDTSVFMWNLSQKCSRDWLKALHLGQVNAGSDLFDQTLLAQDDLYTELKGQWYCRENVAAQHYSSFAFFLLLNRVEKPVIFIPL